MRVCIVVDPLTLNRIMVRHIREVVNSKRHHISLVVVDEYGQGRAPFSFQQKLLYWVYRIISAVGKMSDILGNFDVRGRRSFIGESASGINFRKELPELAKVPVLTPGIRHQDGLRFEYDAASIQRINENADVMFLAGAGRILTGGILSACTYGVLSFHPADTRKYGGRPGGFFEWIEDEAELGVTLQRLSKRLDAGEIINQRTVPLFSALSLNEALRRINEKRVGMLEEALDRLEQNEPMFQFPTPDSRQQVHRFKDALKPLTLGRFACRQIVAWGRSFRRR